MLENVKKAIQQEKQDDTTFPEYFQQYVMEVQDRNLGLELSYMLFNNVVDVLFIDREIASLMKEMHDNDE